MQGTLSLRALFAAVVLVALFPGIAPGSTSGSEAARSMDYAQIARQTVVEYDQASATTAQSVRLQDPGRFVNDMQESQAKQFRVLGAAAERARARGDRLYTYDDILALQPGALGIPDADLASIKASVRDSVRDTRLVYAELLKQGKGRHPVALSLASALSMKFPASAIYVDRDNSDADGRISGGGWPNCNDDNGWGYKNFINSDCFWAYLWDGRCSADITDSFMRNEYTNQLRYCKPAVPRNCSWMIGHSKYHHRH